MSQNYNQLLEELNKGKAAFSKVIVTNRIISREITFHCPLVEFEIFPDGLRISDDGGKTSYSYYVDSFEVYHNLRKIIINDDRDSYLEIQFVE